MELSTHKHAQAPLFQRLLPATFGKAVKENDTSGGCHGSHRKCFISVRDWDINLFCRGAIEEEERRMDTEKGNLRLGHCNAHKYPFDRKRDVGFFVSQMKKPSKEIIWKASDLFELLISIRT